MNTFDKIYEQVKKIPYGRVATYGQIALLAGNPRWSRVVGYALHVNPDPENVRCYRVVNRFGEVSKAFAFGGENEQIRLLKSEGVEVDENGRVDLKNTVWYEIKKIRRHFFRCERIFLYVCLFFLNCFGV